MSKDYYKILQVDMSADQEVIKAAYRMLAKKYHPDTNSSPNAKGKMADINEAFEVLSNASQRKNYDQNLVRRDEETPKETHLHRNREYDGQKSESQNRDQDDERKRQKQKRQTFLIDKYGRQLRQRAIISESAYFFGIICYGLAVGIIMAPISLSLATIIMVLGGVLPGIIIGTITRSILDKIVRAKSKQPEVDEAYPAFISGTPMFFYHKSVLRFLLALYLVSVVGTELGNGLHLLIEG